MEDPKSLVRELSQSVDNSEMVRVLEDLASHTKERSSFYAAQREALLTGLAVLEKENAHLDAGLQQLLLLQTKNVDACNRKNNERLRLAKRMMDLEQRIEQLESGLNEMEADITARDLDIQRVNCPSEDLLYHELVRGFGVTFVRKQGVLYARIRNREHNDMYELRLDGGDVPGLSNEIWRLMG